MLIASAVPHERGGRWAKRGLFVLALSPLAPCSMSCVLHLHWGKKKK